MSDPAVCLPESKEFPNNRGLVLTELQGDYREAEPVLVLSPQAASQTENFFPQEEAAVWIIARVLGLGALSSELLLLLLFGFLVSCMCGLTT